MADFPLVPTRTALINVDMQDCFVEGSPLSSPDGLVVVQRINQLAQACRRRGDPRRPHQGLDRPDGSNLGMWASSSRRSSSRSTPRTLRPPNCTQPRRRTTDLVIDKTTLRRLPRHRPRDDTTLPRNRHGDHLGDRHEHLLRDHRPGGRPARLPRRVPQRRHRNPRDERRTRPRPPTGHTRQPRHGFRPDRHDQRRAQQAARIR